ncbi:MAG: hypothetical protein Q9159_006761 [Coniocarpon cinnabarinum]
MLFQSTLLALAGLLSLSVSKIIYAGVNESGGEFGTGNVPGEFGVDYQFIDESHVQYFLDNGVNLFRVTFLMERMCPLATGLGPIFNETYFDLYQEAIDFITAQGGYAILDPHNYMRYNDPSMQPQSGSIIGNTSDPNAATTEQFQQFWSELAGRFKDDDRVIFGINNEPHNMPTTLVLQNDQAAIDGIRAAGAKQLILVPGNGYTNAENWVNGTGNGYDASGPGAVPSSEVIGNVTDPDNNYAFDMHLYLDFDFSGTHEACVSTDFGPQNLELATQWLQQNGYKAMLSEFGGGANEVCYEAVRNTIQYLEDHDEFLGWSYWAAGPLWGDYFLSVEPNAGPEFLNMYPQILNPAIQSYQPIRRDGLSDTNN